LQELQKEKEENGVLQTARQFLNDGLFAKVLEICRGRMAEPFRELQATALSHQNQLSNLTELAFQGRFKEILAARFPSTKPFSNAVASAIIEDQSLTSFLTDFQSRGSAVALLQFLTNRPYVSRSPYKEWVLKAQDYQVAEEFSKRGQYTNAFLICSRHPGESPFQEYGGQLIDRQLRILMSQFGVKPDSQGRISKVEIEKVARVEHIPTLPEFNRYRGRVADLRTYYNSLPLSPKDRKECEGYLTTVEGNIRNVYDHDH
jgi:hypothetical protein